MAGLTHRNTGHRLVVVFGAALLAAAARPARAGSVLIESFENTLDGWSINGDQAANFTNVGFTTSTTAGVTNGSYALQIGATAANAASANPVGPSYQILLASPVYTSPFAINLTNTLATATSISFDIYTPYNSFGYYLQFEPALQTNAAGYPYIGLTGFNATNIGSETTLTAPLTASENATFAADAAAGVGTVLDLQVGGGYSAGNETFAIDNFEATVPDVASPEPASMCLFGLPAAALLARRRAGRRG